MTVAEEGLPAEGTVAEGAAAGVAVAPQRRATSFAGDVLKLVSGTTLAQAIGVLVTPILTRMYAPEAFGTLALFTSITSIIGVVACLRYELAIMLPETDEEAANLLAVSLVAVVAITALTVPAVTLGRPLLVRLLKAPDLGSYLWLVPIAVFFGGVFHSLNYWNSRTKRFGRLSVVRVVNSLTTHVAKLGVGYAGFASSGALIGATVLGPAVSAAELGRRVWREDGRLFRHNLSQKAVRRGITRYQRFPLVDIWNALMNVVSLQLPTLLLSAFFSTSVVGYYSLGYRVLSIPMALIGGAIAQIFYQRSASASATSSMAPVVDVVLRFLFSIAALPFLLLALTGDDLFAVCFGTQWSEAGRYAQILAPWLLLTLIGSPVSTLYCTLERQSSALAFNAALLATRVTTLVVGGLAHDVRLALILFSGSGALLWTLFCGYLISIAGVDWRRMGKSLSGAALATLLFALPSALTKWVLGAPPSVILLVSAAAGAGYYVHLFRCDSEMRSLTARLTTARY